MGRRIIKTRAVEIEKLKKAFPDWNIDEYAKALGLTYRQVRYIYDIKGMKRKNGRPFKEANMDIICKVLNDEDPMNTLSDKKLSDRIFKLTGDRITYSHLLLIRTRNKIPNFKKRKEMYFLKGRKKWKIKKSNYNK
jgi:hypothetical protein